MSTGWTKPRVAKAAAMWADGETGSQIAKTLRVTRSSVLGMMHRRREQFPLKTATQGNRAFGRQGAIADITKQPRPIMAAAKPKPQPKPKEDRMEPVRVFVPPMPVQDEPSPDAFAPLPGTVPALFIDAEGCRWPVTLAGSVMDAATHCCNARRLAGASYCAAHKALSIGPGTEAERSAVRAAKRVGAVEVRALEEAA